MRSLVSAIVLTPGDGKLTITLQGDLAAMLSYAVGTKKPGSPGREAGLSAAIDRNQRWLRELDLAES
jgi:hypothetical protein